MGFLEDLLTATKPLSTDNTGTGRLVLERMIFRYDALAKTARLLLVIHERQGLGGIVILTDNCKTFAIFFTISSNLPPEIMKNPEYFQKDARYRFTVQEVFRILKIEEPLIEGQISTFTDLNRLCIIIASNLPRVFDAFSDEKIDTTYTVLISGKNDHSTRD